MERKIVNEATERDGLRVGRNKEKKSIREMNNNKRSQAVAPRFFEGIRIRRRRDFG